MKRLTFILIIFYACISSIKAQSETQSFNADGIKVIFKPTTKNVIDVRVYFRGGVTNYSAAQAGIENMALGGTVECGTQKYSPTAFKDTSDKYGLKLGSASGYDCGFIKLNCISKYFNQGWDLFSEAVKNPIFDADALKILKERTISINRNYDGDPNNRLEQLEMQNAFVNTPYTTNPDGYEETIKSFTVDDLKNYYKTLLNKNRIFIVVVGNVSKQEVFEKILLSFGNIPSTPYTPIELQSPVFNDKKMVMEKRAIPTNYISAITNAPDFTSNNYVPFLLGVSGLEGHLYHYLKSQSGLVINAGALVMSRKMPYLEMYANGANAQEIMLGISTKLKEIQNEGLDDEWLQHLKNIYISDSYIDEQSSSALNYSLGSAEILGNWQYADDLPKLVQMATLQQVNNALNFYIRGLKWTFLGDTDALKGFTPPDLNPSVK